MMSKVSVYILGAAAVVLVAGGTKIVLDGRPVAKMEKERAQQVAESKTAVNNEDDELEGDDESENDDDSSVAKAPTSPPPTNTNTAPSSGSDAPKSYSLADVAKHAVETDCWSAINNNVYDLTTWVSRHPGGPKAIIGLCGVDGSAKYNKKHTGFAKAADALILLKIGALK